MKTSLTLSALVVVATLIVCGGCTDPDTIANHSAEETPEVDRATAPQDIAEESVDRSPTADRATDSSETRKRLGSNKFAGSDSPLAGDPDGRESSVPEETHTAAGDLADRGSSSRADAASSDLDTNSATEPAEKEPPKEEYKFEFVSSTGEEGLEPGDTIPEISGRDLDNIKFNLTDYEGKVIMLDFWGDW
jgi:hypothetical protein